MNDLDLLNSFFHEARQPIADEGFTQRVMAALPMGRAAAQMRRWRTQLNVASVIAAVSLFVYLFTDSPVDILKSMPSAGALLVSTDDMLVQLLLFIRQLPALLPTAGQLVAVVSLLAVLTLSSRGSSIERFKIC